MFSIFEEIVVLRHPLSDVPGKLVRKKSANSLFLVKIDLVTFLWGIRNSEYISQKGRKEQPRGDGEDRDIYAYEKIAWKTEHKL